MRAEQQVAAQAEAAAQAAAARAADLQRAKRRQEAENLYATTEENLVLFDADPGPDYDVESGSNSQQPGPRRAAGGPQTPRISHGQRKVRIEQRFQAHGQLGLQYRIMLSAEHAAAQEADHERQLAEHQQRVLNYVSNGAPHPGCNGTVVVISWQPILLRSFLGTGMLQIPLCR